MSLVKAAREYLDFMTCGDGITWIDYRAESERLENNLREALEAAEHSVHLTGLCVCPEEWSVDIHGNCSNCGLAKSPRK